MDGVPNEIEKEIVVDHFRVVYHKDSYAIEVGRSELSHVIILLNRQPTGSNESLEVFLLDLISIFFDVSSFEVK